MRIPRPASVLAVFAHPDDELFHGGGALARLAARGVRVTLACATRGEAGTPHPSVGPVEDLASLREQELRRSCERLGLPAPVFLDFHDSARNERLRRDDPRALVNVDMVEVEAAIRRLVHERRPHILITFDPHGGYGHPDHLAVHRATTAAFYSSGVMEPDAPERLFYSAFSQAMYREHAERTRGWGVTDGLDPDVFAVADDLIAYEFDLGPLVEQKRAAFAAHQSAFGVTDAMLADPAPDAARILRAFDPILAREVFTLGAARSPVPHWPLADLFDGIAVRE